MDNAQTEAEEGFCDREIANTMVSGHLTILLAVWLRAAQPKVRWVGELVPVIVLGASEHPSE
ncbi:hypothetical protein LOZ53_003226 [Ophidiomyces ophidiicola]|nr:hypothetical protein LOZ55_005230 [Ophidiomyces ophidiicola]KAI1990347.1 hypothetical protein LOZ53_003226 [Ophidiomyces ophidiicola]KAI1998209.1 hypothetical protein LOZ51_002887 [Ophidiomyces ophidiicola]